MIENGTLDQTVVKVMKEGHVISSSPGKANFKLKLDFDKNYLISFSKEGFITKSIAVNTQLPQERISKPVEPYKIGVKLFKQYEGINIVVYNQPVAKIHFNPMLDEFDYDTDYTKSILSKLNETEKQLEKKAAEERLTTTGTVAGSMMESTTKQNNNSSSSGRLQERNLRKRTADDGNQDQSFIQEPFNREVSQNIELSSGSNENNSVPLIANESEKQKQGYQLYNDTPGAQNTDGADDSNEKISPTIDRETAGLVNLNTAIDAHIVSRIPSRDYDPGNLIHNDSGNDIYSDALHIAPNTTSYRTQWKEQGRTITVIKIVHGINTSEYRKVDYDWGGLYYFKDQYFTISQNVYHWATGEK